MRRAFLTFLCAVLLAGCAAPPVQAGGFGGLIAPAAACPGQSDLGAPAAEQERAMRCMTNFARRRSGLRPLGGSAALARSAARKSADMIRCDEFSHEACHRPFTYWIVRVGFIEGSECWRAAENIAWGSGSLGSVRAIFKAWIDSAGHRENILGRFGQVGIGLRVGKLEGFAGARVWTQHFGAHC
jgi:uncharacterized protein YkwD